MTERQPTEPKRIDWDREWAANERRLILAGLAKPVPYPPDDRL